MPRTARAARGGVTYHVINRGNSRSLVFTDDADYHTFLHLMGLATRRFSLRVFAFCLMPNHFHLVVCPEGNDDLPSWMHWLCTCHAQHRHGRHGTTGRIWENRYKAFPIQTDGHLLAVMRYVERNALRAGLARRAEDWPWGSLAHRYRKTALLHAAPVPLPGDWTAHVNAGESQKDLRRIRRSVNRETPYGDATWTVASAERLGLEHTLRPPGRPPKRRDG